MFFCIECLCDDRCSKIATSISRNIQIDYTLSIDRLIIIVLKFSLYGNYVLQLKLKLTFYRIQSVNKRVINESTISE